MPNSTRAAFQMNYSEAENVAAIALEMGQNKSLLEQAYKVELVDSIGFVGFYQIAIEAAQTLDRIAEQEGVSQWGNEADWIQTIEKYAVNILQSMKHGRFPYKADLEKIASKSIHWF